jgi:HPt (histidine-containing phosphotransfer) domain-containing protein
MTSAKDVPLDLATIAALRALDDGGDALLARLIPVYLECTAALQVTIATAVAARDADALRAAAHRLKGSASGVGAREVAALSRELERIAKEMLWEEAPALLERLREAERLAGVALRELVPRAA